MLNVVYSMWYLLLWHHHEQFAVNEGTRVPMICGGADMTIRYRSEDNEEQKTYNLQLVTARVALNIIVIIFNNHSNDNGKWDGKAQFSYQNSPGLSSPQLNDSPTSDGFF